MKSKNANFVLEELCRQYNNQAAELIKENTILKAQNTELLEKVQELEDTNQPIELVNLIHKAIQHFAADARYKEYTTSYTELRSLFNEWSAKYKATFQNKFPLISTPPIVDASINDAGTKLILEWGEHQRRDVSSNWWGVFKGF